MRHDTVKRPTEVWMLNDGAGWTFSFDPPTAQARRYFAAKDRQCVRLALATDAENKLLRKALRSIEAGDLCGRSEQGGCEWGVDGPCLSCEATAALAPRARSKSRRGGA